MPKSKAQCQEIKDERRLDILTVALRLFAIQGYDAVKVNDIVKACGCSHGLFYHYFSSKEALFQAMMEESRLVGKRCYPKNWLLVDDPVIAIMTFVEQSLLLLQTDEDNCYYMYLYLNMPFQKTLPRHPNRPKSDKYFPQLLEERIKKGQNDHTFIEGNPRELVIFFLCLLRGLFYERLQSDVEHYKCPKSEWLLRVLLTEETLTKYRKD